MASILQREIPFMSSSPEKFSSIAPLGPFPPSYAMDCLCVYVCLCLGYGVIIAWVLLQPVKRWVEPPQTDTWWPLLRIDVWLMTHFWLPLYWFSSLPWPFQTNSIPEAIFEMSTHGAQEAWMYNRIAWNILYMSLCVCVFLSDNGLV